MRAFAPGAPPVSGASSRWQPCFSTSAAELAHRRRRVGREIDEHAVRPSAPRSHCSATARTTAGVGSERKLSSAWRATSSGAEAAAAPASARARAAS